MLMAFFFVNFMNFAANFFQFLPSINLGDKAKTVNFVKGSYDMPYFGKEHVNYLLISGIIFIAFDIILPVIIFLALMFEKKKTKDKLEKNKDSIEKFGLLFLGYKRKYYYWEFIIWIRKVMISFFLYYYKTNSDQKLARFQLINVMIIYMISYILQIKLQPFKYKNLNTLEKYALLFGCGTILTALLVENNFNVYYSWIASFFMIIFPVVFYFVWFSKYYFPIVWKKRVKAMMEKRRINVGLFLLACLFFREREVQLNLR